MARSGSFKSTKKYLTEQASKALNGVFRKIRYFDLPIDCQFDLFNSVISPILFYGCEVWGYENTDILEKVHLTFLKFVLHIKSSTPNCIVYGETGRYPLIIFIKVRIITYWAKLLLAHDCKLTHIMCRYFYKCFSEGSFMHPWLLEIFLTHVVFPMSGLIKVFLVSTG